MDIKQLRSFTAIVEYRNFSKAAEKLGISQPTVSTHIRALEKELHTQLFLRTTKNIQITENGWKLYTYAVKILELSDRLVEICRSEDKSIE